MKVLESELLAFFDVDDTLVLWGMEQDPRVVPFVDPHDQNEHLLVPHERHIKLLRDFKDRGYMIIVWSGGGYQWAETVVKTLGITDFVDFVMTKPTKYIDDLCADEILGSRIYLKLEELKND